MNLFLANPAGLWALFGIPAVLLIHLLRRKSREVTVSTLFLVERALPSSEGGRRLRHLRNSLPLWIQILAVIALAWLLSQPRWVDETSTQTVVAIFDESASMSAFRNATLEAAAGELRRSEPAAAKTQWIALGSDRSRLASAAHLADLLHDVREGWHPTLGTHGTDEVFRLARTLAGANGTVLFFTDHPAPADAAPAGVEWVASGEPIENAGFLGTSAEGSHWSALIKNFGRKPREVSWRVVGENSPWKSLSLEPDAVGEISGEFPASGQLTLELQPDGFTPDDRLPIIAPREKSLDISMSGEADFQPLFEQLLKLAGTPAATGAKPDLSLTVFDPLSPASSDQAAIVFVRDIDKTTKPLAGQIVAENDSLMDGLSWQGLIARDTLTAPFRDGDTALLWQGTRPMIFLHTAKNGPQLVFNFDVRLSNAQRLPAFALLIHRFLTQQRAAKVAYEARNVDAGQEIAVAGKGTLRAPSLPEFFAVKGADGTPLLDAAAQFADSRESDFRGAATWRSEISSANARRQANAVGSFLDPLWVTLLAGFMLWNWTLTGRPRQTRS